MKFTSTGDRVGLYVIRQLQGDSEKWPLRISFYQSHEKLSFYFWLECTGRPSCRVINLMFTNKRHAERARGGSITDPFRYKVRYYCGGV